MNYYFTIIKDYLFYQANLHQVNPWLFGALYLLSKILFLLFLGLAVKKLREKSPVLVLLLFAALGYSLPYFYLIIAGKNIPLWIYLVIGVIYIFSGWSIRAKFREARRESAIDDTSIPTANEMDNQK
jgi:Zn-dependent protease with chaperone function